MWAERRVQVAHRAPNAHGWRLVAVDAVIVAAVPVLVVPG